jgi:hypothetical protein
MTILPKKHKAPSSGGGAQNQNNAGNNGASDGDGAVEANAQIIDEGPEEAGEGQGERSQVRGRQSTRRK